MKYLEITLAYVARKAYNIGFSIEKYLEIIFLKGTINMNINLLEGIEIEYKSADLAKTLSLL
ncbi:TPA: hypothetical protein ACG56V_000584 [Streptococcus agalactiae]